ncbi:MAG TPA: aromatic ring-opening dioxygenase LigA [Candidatus Limnocylindria bacterium]
MGQSREAGRVVMLGRLVSVTGAATAIAGVAAWMTVRVQLAAERIVVPSSAPWFAGQEVRGPHTAFAQAEAIRRTAVEATGGRTYGEMAADDPMAAMAMNASLLRSSLFTSVLAFGTAGAQVGIGAVLVAVGAGLARAGRLLQEANS